MFSDCMGYLSIDLPISYIRSLSGCYCPLFVYLYLLKSECEMVIWQQYITFVERSLTYNSALYLYTHFPSNFLRLRQTLC